MKKIITSSKKTILTKLSALSALFIFPVVSFAQTAPDPGGTTTVAVVCDPNGGLGYLLCRIQEVISSIIPVLVSLAVLIFIFGIVKYISSKDADARKEAGGYMVWGIISLFVMVSVWGLVALLGRSVFGNAYGGENTSATRAPNVTQIPDGR